MNKDTEGMTVWAAGFGGYGAIAGDGNAEGLHHDSAGFLAGADFAVAPDLRLGVVAGYTSNSARTSGRLSAANGDAGHVGAWANWRGGGVDLAAGGELGFGTVHIARAIPALGLQSSGAQDQETGQVFADGGYVIPLEALELRPHAAIAHIVASSGAFAESGDVSALSGDAKTDSQTYGLLGLHAAISDIELDGMDLTPRLDIGWQHAFSPFLPVQHVAYRNAGTGFLVQGAPLARDAAAIQAGFDLSLGAAALFLAYDGSFAATVENHAVRGGLDWRF